MLMSGGWLWAEIGAYRRRLVLMIGRWCLWLDVSPYGRRLGLMTCIIQNQLFPIMHKNQLFCFKIFKIRSAEI